MVVSGMLVWSVLSIFRLWLSSARPWASVGVGVGPVYHLLHVALRCLVVALVARASWSSRGVAFWGRRGFQSGVSGCSSQPCCVVFAMVARSFCSSTRAEHGPEAALLRFVLYQFWPIFLIFWPFHFLYIVNEKVNLLPQLKIKYR
jgi:hypothetical protein